MGRNVRLHKTRRIRSFLVKAARTSLKGHVPVLHSRDLWLWDILAQPFHALRFTHIVNHEFCGTNVWHMYFILRLAFIRTIIIVFKDNLCVCSKLRFLIEIVLFLCNIHIHILEIRHHFGYLLIKLDNMVIYLQYYYCLTKAL